MAVKDGIAVALGVLLAAGACFYGLVRLSPGDWRRWPVFLACGVVATQFGWYPLVSTWCAWPLSADEQWLAVGLATVGLKVVAENVVPLFLLPMEGDDDEREI